MGDYMDNYVPPRAPANHIELLNYRWIWDQIQQTPTLAAAARETGFSYNKLNKINSMLEKYWVEGRLEDWLRVTEKLLGIQIQRGADHKTDRLMLELRQVFVEYVRDPENHDPPTNEDIEWGYQELLKDFSSLQNAKHSNSDPKRTLTEIEEIINESGKQNFTENKGSWSSFEKQCALITNCGWKMGLVKSSSKVSNGNAINRMYTTGAVRSYPKVLIHCLFIDDFLDLMTDVYRNEFGEKMRCTPIMILVCEDHEFNWRPKRILVQDKHPLLPLNKKQITDLFPSAEIVRVETTPFELTEGWGNEDDENRVNSPSPTPKKSDDIDTTSKLKDSIDKILQLQKDYSSANTPMMEERGVLIRKTAPAILRGWIEGFQIDFSAPARVNDGLTWYFQNEEDTIADLHCKGSDGVGRKTRIPWFRIFNPRHSPSATSGWYIVYLFAFDGSCVYLSLNQGTTIPEEGNFVPRSSEQLEERVNWAIDFLPLSKSPSPRLEYGLMDLRDSKKLAKGYERGDVMSFRYSAGNIPEDKKLREDVLVMINLLERLYRHEEGTFG